MGPSFSVFFDAAVQVAIGLGLVVAALNGDVSPILLTLGVALWGIAALLLRPRIEIGDTEVVVRNLRSVTVRTADCIEFVPVGRPWAGASLLVHEQFEIRARASRVFPLFSHGTKEYAESFDRRLVVLNDELDRRRPAIPD